MDFKKLLGGLAFILVAVGGTMYLFTEPSERRPLIRSTLPLLAVVYLVRNWVGYMIQKRRDRARERERMLASGD